MADGIQFRLLSTPVVADEVEDILSGKRLLADPIRRGALNLPWHKGLEVSATEAAERAAGMPLTWRVSPSAHGPRRGEGLKPILKPTGRGSMRQRANKRAGVDLKIDARRRPATTRFESPFRALPQNLADPDEGFCLKTNPTGCDDDEAVQQASRHDLARALAPRYKHASRRDKGQLLDEFCAITGYTRKHALVLLRDPPAEQSAATRRGAETELWAS
jgi:hypothetical protein